MITSVYVCLEADESVGKFEICGVFDDLEAAQACERENYAFRNVEVWPTDGTRGKSV